MRVLILIFLSLFNYNIDSQRFTISGTVEKFEDEFENTYYPIWTGEATYYLNKYDSVRCLQLTYWSNTDFPMYAYINIIYYHTEQFWISINPLRADIYNPTITIGFTVQPFKPPR